jgi:hypothetical protein
VSRLRDIPIRIESRDHIDRPSHTEPPSHVEPPARSGGLGGGVAAILSEAAGLLETLANGGQPAMIDLRSLPMSPEDRAALQGALGAGEVRVTLDADGTSTFYETGIAGLWWVEHRDRADTVIAELLEIARFPAILDTVPAEIAASAVALRALLQPYPAAQINLAAHSVPKHHATRQ